MTWRTPSLALPDLDHLPPLDRLAELESVRLFVERARDAAPSFVLDATTPCASSAAAAAPANVVSCPQPGCGASAEIVDRWVWPSTNGPVEHAKTWCVNGHGFTPTMDSLTRRTPSPPEPAVRVPVG